MQFATTKPVLQKILKGITQKRKIKATMKVKERINVTR
jgi:hypothetical protein